jgi:hypothetical protein
MRCSDLRLYVCVYRAVGLLSAAASVKSSLMMIKLRFSVAVCGGCGAWGLNLPVRHRVPEDVASRQSHGVTGRSIRTDVVADSVATYSDDPDAYADFSATAVASLFAKFASLLAPGAIVLGVDRCLFASIWARDARRWSWWRWRQPVITESRCLLLDAEGFNAGCSLRMGRTCRIDPI